MDWTKLLALLVLALVAIRESLLLVAGLAAKRRTDNTIGGQSLERWQIEGRRMVGEVVEEKLKLVHADLDELLDRRRRRK